MRDLHDFVARTLDLLPIPVLEIDSNHRVTHWNAALESLSGISKKEAIGTDNQWRAFYGARRPVLADLIADGAAEDEIRNHYGDKARKSHLIEGAYEAEDFFPSLGENGRWYHFTASPIREQGNIIGAIEILEDVTARCVAEQNLKYYIGEVTRVQEEERKRISRELHDTAVQTLVALIYQVENFIASKPDLTGHDLSRLKLIKDNLKNAVEETRQFSRLLRPPILDDLGLVPALESLRSEFRKIYGIEVMLNVWGSQRRITPEVELMLFRIIQEALNNAAKHSGESSAEVHLEFRDNAVCAVVLDRGKGFEVPVNVGSLPRTGKLGLAGIAERVQLMGGSFNIASSRDTGTTLTVQLPLK